MTTSVRPPPFPWERVALALITAVLTWLALELRALREELTDLKVAFAALPPPDHRSEHAELERRIRALELANERHHGGDKR